MLIFNVFIFVMCIYFNVFIFVMFQNYAVKYHTESKLVLDVYQYFDVCHFVFKFQVYKLVTV